MVTHLLICLVALSIYRLVALSIVIAVIASYTALDLAGHGILNRSVSSGYGALPWGLVSGQCTSSQCSPITAHPVDYNSSIVFASLALAVIASGLFLYCDG